MRNDTLGIGSALKAAFMAGAQSLIGKPLPKEEASEDLQSAMRKLEAASSRLVSAALSKPDQVQAPETMEEAMRRIAEGMR